MKETLLRSENCYGDKKMKSCKCVALFRCKAAILFSEYV